MNEKKVKVECIRCGHKFKVRIQPPTGCYADIKVVFCPECGCHNILERTFDGENDYVQERI